MCQCVDLKKVDLGPQLRPDQAEDTYKCVACGKLWEARELAITVQRGRQPK